MRSVGLWPGLAAMAVVGVTGTVLAVAMASLPEWRTEPISVLSRDPAAGGLFRATMIATGAIGFAVAPAVAGHVAALREAGWMTPGWARAWGVGWIGLAAGFVGVGLFALGVSPWLEIAHGAAAYAVPMLVLAAMLTARLAIPRIGDRIGRASLAALAVILVAYVGAVAGVVPYALMEVIAFGIGGAWIGWILWCTRGAVVTQVASAR